MAGGTALRIGAVVARTGRLASLGAPLEFAVDLLRPWLAGRGGDGRRPPIKVLVADSRSTVAGARAATEALVLRDGVQIVVTLGGSATLPAVADTCERLATPCLTTVLPWQVYLYGRGGSAARPFRWTFHAGWGLDDIATVFADLWDQVAPGAAVGCLWNAGTQGSALRDARHGFTPAARDRGYRLVDPPGYAEPAAGFGRQIGAFGDRGVRIVTSAATAADLAGFVAQAADAGFTPDLVTCSRWLTYPFGVRRYGLDRVATIVYWTPAHRYRSSVDGGTPAGLARRYERATGGAWAQPLGPAHALVEVAAHVLAAASDPGDLGEVADLLGRTRLETVAGVLDWTAGPVPNVARVPLAAGQWRAGDRPELVVVDNTRAPAVPRSGDLLVRSR